MNWIATLIHFWWKCKQYGHFAKQFSSFLKFKHILFVWPSRSTPKYLYQEKWKHKSSHRLVWEYSQKHYWNSSKLETRQLVAPLWSYGTERFPYGDILLKITNGLTFSSSSLDSATKQAELWPHNRIIYSDAHCEHLHTYVLCGRWPSQNFSGLEIGGGEAFPGEQALQVSGRHRDTRNSSSLFRS